MNIWQLQTAKARLSKVIRQAIKKGSQTISVRGEETVVVISQKDYTQLITPEKSFWDFMKSSPLKGVSLDIDRSKERN